MQYSNPSLSQVRPSEGIIAINGAGHVGARGGASARRGRNTKREKNGRVCLLIGDTVVKHFREGASRPSRGVMLDEVWHKSRDGWDTVGMWFIRHLTFFKIFICYKDCICICSKTSLRLDQ